jgi:hypothetical protein
MYSGKQSMSDHHTKSSMTHASSSRVLFMSLHRWQQLQVFVALLFILATFFIRIIPTQAAGALSFTATATPTTVETGEVVSYLLDFSCGGVDGACGTLDIDFDFTDLCPYMELITPIAVSDGFTSNIAGNVLTISDSNFQDGDAGQATVQFRVRTTLTDGATVPLVNIVAEISDDAGEPIIIETPTQITINDPTPQWSVNKSVTSPSVGPTVNNGSNDAYVRYSVNYCADTGIGNEPVTGAVLVDELPNDRASGHPAHTSPSNC